MSVQNNPFFKPHTPSGFSQQPGGAFPKPTQATGGPSGPNPFQAAFGSQPPQPDQLGVFKNLVQAGNFNVNKPALPYTASVGWSA